MFSLFKKQPKYPSYQDDPVGFLLWYADGDIRSTREAMPAHYANRNYEYVTRNSDCALREILTKHALQLRSNKNLNAAQEELKAAPEFLDHIEDAIAKADARGLILPPNKAGNHDSNFIYVSNLLYAFPTIFLMQDWARAGRLAKALKHPVLRENISYEKDKDGGVHCHIIKMFAALILDDQDEFKLQQQRFAKG
jgi:hypothetical protein